MACGVSAWHLSTIDSMASDGVSRHVSCIHLGRSLREGDGCGLRAWLGVKQKYRGGSNVVKLSRGDAHFSPRGRLGGNPRLGVAFAWRSSSFGKNVRLAPSSISVGIGSGARLAVAISGGRGGLAALGARLAARQTSACVTAGHSAKQRLKNRRRRRVRRGGDAAAWRVASRLAAAACLRHWRLYHAALPPRAARRAKILAA